MLQISPAQKRELRARAHHLHPVVSIAEKGLSPAVLKEVETALKAHELIKVRVYGDERSVREEILASICTQLGCAAVQHIGKLLVIYRPNPEKQTVTAKPAASKSARTPRIATGAPAKSGSRTQGRSIPARTSAAPVPRARKPAVTGGRVKKSAR